MTIVVNGEAVAKANGTAANIQGSLYLDEFLTNWSEQYIQDESKFLSMKAATQIPVMKETGKYRIYDRGFFLRDEAQPRALGGRPVEVGYKLDEGSYDCTEYALAHTVDDRQRANAKNQLNLDINATRLLTGKHMIKQERVWSTSFFQTGIWTLEFTGVASSPAANQFVQFDQDSSDPIQVIDQFKDHIERLTGFRPNTMVAGAGVKRALRANADITDRIKHTQTGIASDALIAELFELDNFMVARSIYNTADEGQTNSFSYIIDERSFWLGYIHPEPDQDAPTAIAQFNWEGLLDGQANAMGGAVTRGRYDDRYSDWFHVRMAWDLKLVSQDLGCFFLNAVGTSNPVSVV